MRELDRLRGFVLGQEHNFTDSQSADVHALLDLAEQRWAKLNARVMASMSAALLDTTEQPDPTAEALQEAADEYDESFTGEAAKGPVFKDGDDMIDGVLVSPAAAPVTIGSYSDVSDDDVRAAGGEPFTASPQAVTPEGGASDRFEAVKMGMVQQSMTRNDDDIDFGPKA